jgi:hypothetical protein
MDDDAGIEPSLPLECFTYSLIIPQYYRGFN